MKRIRYVSQFSQEMSEEAIGDLATRASHRNSQLGITGFLLTSGRLFFQVLEGPDSQVDGLFEDIVADPRHKDVLLLDTELEITQRFFPSWSMRPFDLDHHADARLEPVRQMLVSILEKRQEIARLTRALEKAIWYEAAAGLAEGV
ncbi:MAG: BLUF domain-containing protein [Myxococcota bacterium]|jgi:hypothetical protein|nr:BLUF domain-containing protein [Myxococcota bacterium]